MSNKLPKFIQDIYDGNEFAKETAMTEITLKELGVNVEPKGSVAEGMCSLYNDVDARISKDIVTFGPIGKNGEHLCQLKIGTDMLRAIINYVDTELKEEE